MPSLPPSPICQMSFRPPFRVRRRAAGLSGLAAGCAFHISSAQAVPLSLFSSSLSVLPCQMPNELRATRNFGARQLHFPPLNAVLSFPITLPRSLASCEASEVLRKAGGPSNLKRTGGQSRT